MKNYRRIFSLISIVAFLFTITGLNGCDCNKPFIERVEVWIIRDEAPYEEQIFPIGSTYKIPKNTSFRIKIKTQETISNLNNSTVQITSSITIPIEYLEDTWYKADYDNLSGTLDTGTYNVTIIINHNGRILTQSIVIQIEQELHLILKSKS